MRLFLPLLFFFACAAILIFIGFSLLVLPGFVVAAFIAFAAFYMLPLMTDKGYGMIDALKRSWDIATRPPVNDHIVVTIIYVAIVSLGGSLPFAFLITQPLATFILVGAYQERVVMIDGPWEQPVSRPSPPPPPPHSAEGEAKRDEAEAGEGTNDKQ
jgi:hypothetical protein